MRRDGNTPARVNIKEHSSARSDVQALRVENAKLKEETRNLRASVLTAGAEVSQQLERSYSEQLRIERTKIEDMEKHYYEQLRAEQSRNADLEKLLHCAQAHIARMALKAAPAEPTRDPRMSLSRNPRNAASAHMASPLIQETSAMAPPCSDLNVSFGVPWLLNLSPELNMSLGPPTTALGSLSGMQRALEQGEIEEE
ncbi:hypothetical protein B0H17DRAFT_1210129 [Mycena rosella]|uniref:Uncharacterized protein n=1 Tax=Mycena rosella TaxID=1033263 RepID=A0AAD7D0S1_MYCRO|nr:hypothetical protein B0H17DRAFT_1210129 [Mycena rosella]